MRLYHNNQPYPSPSPQHKPYQCVPTESHGSCHFQHPFTMIVSGPTGCGKTQWVYNLLMSDFITPPPQRIIIFYKRWQPLYDCMRNLPNVEFHNEIPPNLGSDACLKPCVRNLVIIDDLMTTASKNPQVTELFCEGSHHRNLSVVALNQNLYFGKDPTQRRNAQYLVLFKNPIDCMPVQTLADVPYK